MNRRNVCFSLVIASAVTLGLPPVPTQAQSNYPNRPIRLVVPYAPGGNTDISSRALAAKLIPLLGQQIIIDNRAGAGGTIGSTEVARANPDGYTLLVGTSGSHVISSLTRKNPSYDPVKDFAPIAVFGIVPTGIAVHPIVANSLRKLIERVKANPGKYSYGHSGSGGITNLSGELFKQQAGGLDIVPIPYKGGGPSVRDLIAGQIPIAVVTFSTVLPFYRSGRLRILAVFSDKRSKQAPDIPTAVELGVPGMVAYTFTVFLAPAGTPKPIIDRLSQATRKSMADEAFQKVLERAGVEPVTDSNPEKAAQFVKDEIAKWGAVVKATGTKAN